MSSCSLISWNLSFSSWSTLPTPSGLQAELAVTGEPAGHGSVSRPPTEERRTPGPAQRPAHTTGRLGVTIPFYGTSDAPFKVLTEVLFVMHTDLRRAFSATTPPQQDGIQYIQHITAVVSRPAQPFTSRSEHTPVPLGRTCSSHAKANQQLSAGSSERKVKIKTTTSRPRRCEPGHTSATSLPALRAHDFPIGSALASRDRHFISRAPPTYPVQYRAISSAVGCDRSTFAAGDGAGRVVSVSGAPDDSASSSTAPGILSGAGSQ